MVWLSGLTSASVLLIAFAFARVNGTVVIIDFGTVASQGGLVRLFSRCLGQGGMNTQILLGDPGTSLTTAVSNNVLRREPLPTVRALARAVGLALVMRKQKKQRSRWPTSHVQSHSCTHLYFFRSDTLLPYAVDDREGRSFTGLYTTDVAMRLEYAASTAVICSDSSSL